MKRRNSRRKDPNIKEAEIDIQDGAHIEVEEVENGLKIIQIDLVSPFRGKLKAGDIILELNGMNGLTPDDLDFAKDTVKVRFLKQSKASGIGKLLNFDPDAIIDPDSEISDEEAVLTVELNYKGDMPELVLEESIYTAAIVIPLAFPKYGWSWDGIANIFRVAQVYLLFMANVGVQLFLAYYVQIMWQEQHESEQWETCGWDNDANDGNGEYSTKRLLRMFCILVYTAVCVGDAIQSFWMAMWIAYAPSGPFELLQVGPSVKDKELTVIKNGIPFWIKFNGIFFVIGSKLLIAWVLILYGGGYVLGAQDDEELLLNALAIAFILELDEVMFEFFLPKTIKKFCSEMPTVVAEGPIMESITQTSSLIGMSVNALFLGVTTSICYEYFCNGGEE